MKLSESVKRKTCTCHRVLRSYKNLILNSKKKLQHISIVLPGSSDDGKSRPPAKPCKDISDDEPKTCSRTKYVSCKRYIEVVFQFKYQGANFSMEGNFGQDVNGRISLASFIGKRLTNVWTQRATAVSTSGQTSLHCCQTSSEEFRQKLVSSEQKLKESVEASARAHAESELLRERLHTASLTENKLKDLIERTQKSLNDTLASAESLNQQLAACKAREKEMNEISALQSQISDVTLSADFAQRLSCLENFSKSLLQLPFGLHRLKCALGVPPHRIPPMVVCGLPFEIRFSLDLLLQVDVFRISLLSLPVVKDDTLL
ncbi:unnamed protein product [Soboliphyme baturini]|uniref:Kinesin motor domain-containing protein n=1 Tax=Soboliphyme baturini TaxID=241478 RepID=A0A183J1J5_9BILA|nr:unnamed protein product [Soboliphyme baturini]